MDFSQLNSAEQAHMSKVIEKKQVPLISIISELHFFNNNKKNHQMQDFLRMYSNLVEKCFNSCCNDFTSKALSSKEVPYDFFSRLLEALNLFVTNLAGTM